MAATLAWFQSDDVTPLGTLDVGAIPPGSSYFERYGAYYEARIHNTGDENFASVEVEIQQNGNYIGYTHVRIAPDSGGSAGAFQDHSANPLAVGALAAAAQASVWLDVIVPTDAVAERGQKSSLVVLGSL